MRLRLYALSVLFPPLLALALASCTAPAPVCAPSCAAGYVCHQGTCVTDTGRDAGGSPDLLTGTCVPACGGGSPFCNGTNHCVACRADGDCPLGKICKAGGDGKPVCAPGCTDDSRCRANPDGGAGASCCGGHCVDTDSDVLHCGA